MKVRDSGMPEERLWASFFDVDFVLDQVLLQRPVPTVVEFGCGYGTFTIPAVRRTIGVVHAIDIERDMVAATCDKAARPASRTCRVRWTPIVGQNLGLNKVGAARESLYSSRRGRIR